MTEKTDKMPMTFTHETPSMGLTDDQLAQLGSMCIIAAHNRICQPEDEAKSSGDYLENFIIGYYEACIYDNKASGILSEDYESYEERIF